MSEVTLDHVGLVSPRNCVHCGQTLMTTVTVDSADLSASDTDNNRADEAASSTVEHQPRVVVSDPSLVSSRSSTPRDGFVPPPAPLTGSDDGTTTDWHTRHRCPSAAPAAARTRPAEWTSES